MLLGEHAVSIWNEISEAGLSNSRAWQLHEHMAECLGILGFVRGRRYLATDGATQQKFRQAR